VPRRDFTHFIEDILDDDCLKQCIPVSRLPLDVMRGSLTT